MNFLMLPLFFLSGALFPLSNIPGWLMILTLINPATYRVDVIRKVALERWHSAYRGGGQARGVIVWIFDESLGGRAHRTRFWHRNDYPRDAVV